MSDTDHIGDSAESVNRSFPVELHHPLAQDTHVLRGNVRDILNNCSATLHMLSDLFGDTDMERYPVLDSAAARRGMFLQLQGVAETLNAVERFLGIEAERACEAREAEQQARRAEEDRIAEDPAAIEKRAILAGAFADCFRLVLSGAKPTTA